MSVTTKVQGPLKGFPLSLFLALEMVPSRESCDGKRTARMTRMRDVRMSAGMRARKETAM
jgi:hypothetical protein